MNTICLSTAYLAPISYYCAMMHSERTLIEQHENYVKQSYRNRAIIATANGEMPLTLPVEHHKGEKVLIRDLRLSDHGNWRHLHWQAIQSAYDRSPYFEYYADDFHPFYESRPTEFLLDYNLRLQELICSLINLDCTPMLTETYERSGDFADLRNAISPKTRTTAMGVATAKPYYQVFSQRHGFIADLSIIDLLFNMGPEALLVLRDATINEHTLIDTQ